MALDKIFNFARWILLFSAVVVSIFVVLVPDPIEQFNILGGITGRPYDNQSAIVPVILILIALFITTQAAYYAMKVESDRIIGAGIDRSESCISGTLHHNSDFGWIVAGGVKAFGWEGNSVWINPLSHIHRICNVIAFEAKMSPNTDLADVPPDLKIDILQRSDGILGIKDCCVGLLTPKESKHTKFDGSQYAEAKTDEARKIHTTAAFITNVMAKIRAIDIQFLLFRNNASAIEEKIASIKKIGAAASNADENKGIFDRISFKISRGWLILIIFSLLIIGLYLWYGDKTTEPEYTNNIPVCPEKYNLITDSTNTSQLICFKEGTVMRVKMTFPDYMVATLFISSMILFLAEFVRRDRSSLIMYYKNKYTNDKPINRHTDIKRSHGYLWTHKGYDQIVEQCDNEVHVCRDRNDIRTNIERNLIFKGEAQALTPQQLYEYLGKRKDLFFEIIGEPIDNFDTKAVIESAPKIYYPRPMSNEEKEAYYSLNGGYTFDSDRFNYVINLLLRIFNDVMYLDPNMHDSMKGMMKKGEDYVSATSRMSKEADNTRKTDTVDKMRMPQKEESRNGVQ